MNYSKFSDEEILEAYNSMLDYSGKPDEEMKAEVDGRGGLKRIKDNVAERSIIQNEIKRINHLVFSLYKENADTDNIKLGITSDILPIQDLNNAIDLALEKTENHIRERKISIRTIVGSILGILISSIIGAGIWIYLILQTGEMNYEVTTVILIISYVIIRLLTGQSNNNLIVFIATFLSAAMAILLMLFVFL